MWEPGVLLAAKLREALGVAGQGVEQATIFRNKDLMKQVITKAGLRTARHASARSIAEVKAAAEQIGFPIIVKPIAGAGSMDTFRAGSMAELEAELAKVTTYDEVNVEEFIEGDEYTYDTICIKGEVQYENVCFYRPNPLIARSTEWISPQTLALRDMTPTPVASGVALGHEVLKAMGFQTGFTHMEFFWTPKGEAVFGEIAARPAGAHTVDLMNYVGDIDLYMGYAEAELRRHVLAVDGSQVQRLQHLQAGRGAGAHQPHRRIAAPPAALRRARRAHGPAPGGGGATQLDPHARQRWLRGRAAPGVAGVHGHLGCGGDGPAAVRVLIGRDHSIASARARGRPMSRPRASFR
jgi:hypothetical protein